MSNTESKRFLEPNEWVDNYSDELYRFIYLRVGDSFISEDILQETYLSAWRAKETYKGEASEKNWLIAICKNKIFDHFRKKSNDIILLSSKEDDLYFKDNEHWKDEETPKNWEKHLEEPVSINEFDSVLAKCKKKLNDIQERIFVMKYLDDLDSKYICKTLNISSSNYWVLIHRCKLNLRSCLEKNWLNN